jgi:anti-anti-sigma factor
MHPTGADAAAHRGRFGANNRDENTHRRTLSRSHSVGTVRQPRVADGTMLTPPTFRPGDAMKIETTAHDSHTTIVLRGEFDTEASGAFLAKVEDLVAGDQAHIMVSFRYVKYINSTALGAIVRARSDCRGRGGDLVVIQPSRLTRDIISKMGLDSVLPIFDDEAAAVDYLEGKAEAPAAAEASPSEPTAEIRVMFSFDDERANLIPGKSKHGVGVLSDVDASQLVFRWHPEASGCDPSAAATMFTTGSKMRNKLQLKLLRKEFFEGESTVQTLTLNESGDVTVTASWSRIADADRDALARYKKDLEFLQSHSNQRAAEQQQ